MSKVVFRLLSDDNEMRHSVSGTLNSLLMSEKASVIGCVRPADTSSRPCLIPDAACCRSSRNHRIACKTTSSRSAYRPVANSCSTKGSSSGGSSICIVVFSLIQHTMIGEIRSNGETSKACSTIIGSDDSVMLESPVRKEATTSRVWPIRPFYPVGGIPIPKCRRRFKNIGPFKTQDQPRTRLKY
jgi:hypothetical protein